MRSVMTMRTYDDTSKPFRFAATRTRASHSASARRLRRFSLSFGFDRGMSRIPVASTGFLLQRDNCTGRAVVLPTKSHSPDSQDYSTKKMLSRCAPLDLLSQREYNGTGRATRLRWDGLSQAGLETRWQRWPTQIG